MNDYIIKFSKKLFIERYGDIKTVQEMVNNDDILKRLMDLSDSKISEPLIDYDFYSDNISIRLKSPLANEISKGEQYPVVDYIVKIIGDNKNYMSCYHGLIFKIRNLHDNGMRCEETVIGYLVL